MAFLPAIASTLNVMATRFIDTGDRTLDQSLLIISTITISYILTNIITYYKMYYNAFIYIIWNLSKDPMNIKNVPFLLEDAETIKKIYKCMSALIVLRLKR